jgi:hypothetical protein
MFNVFLLKLLDVDDSHSLSLPDPRQGRDFQGASQRTQGPNPAQAGSGGTFRNTVAADIISPRPNSRPVNFILRSFPILHTSISFISIYLLRKAS